LRSREEFEQMVVRQSEGATVRLRDVADVVLGAEDYDTVVNFTGQTAVFIGVWSLPNANSLDVIKRVRAELASLQKELPEQIQATIAYDATAYIRSAISEVVQTLLETVLIVVIVIFLFLGSLRSSLVPVVAIPLSLIGGIFLVQTFGFTINLLTLLAIVLSVGLVVDDAIVVVENVERHLREGLKPIDAALKGARELVGPIIAMTITLAAVYTPAKSTIDQITPLTREIHKEMASIPETQFTFQITFPNGGFYGDGLKPWSERKRNAFQVLPELSAKVAAIPGVQTFAVVPPS